MLPSVFTTKPCVFAPEETENWKVMEVVVLGWKVLSSDCKVQEKNSRVLTALIGTVFMSLNGKGVAKTWRRTESMSGLPFRCVVLLPLSMPFFVASSCHILHVTCPVRLHEKKTWRRVREEIVRGDKYVGWQ